MVKRIKIYTILVSLIVFGMLAFGCSSKKEETVQETTQILPAKRGDIVVEVMASGNLVMSREANLSFSASSKVTEVLVDIGDWVDEGDKLAAIDTVDLEINLAEAETNVKSAKLDLEEAKEPSTNSSGTQIVTAPDPLNIEIKELKYETAKMSLADVEEQLAGAVIYAPFSGRIAKVNVSVGDDVNSSTEVIRLIDPDFVEVDIAVSEMDIYDLKVGSGATIQLNAMQTVVLPGKVASINPVANVQSGVVNYSVNVKVDPLSGVREEQKAEAKNSPVDVFTIPDDFELKEGLTVTVTITADQSLDAVLVPNAAITTTRNGITSIQVMNNGMPEQRVVTVGLSDYQYSEIKEGLEEGEQVVVSALAASNTATTATEDRQMGPDGPPSIWEMY
jgi:macrolide-specific efflux system membrane fusion protein